MCSSGYVRADLATSDPVKYLCVLNLELCDVLMEIPIAEGSKPVAVLVVVEMTLTTAVALDVGVCAKGLQAASRT